MDSLYGLPHQGSRVQPQEYYASCCNTFPEELVYVRYIVQCDDSGSPFHLRPAHRTGRLQIFPPQNVDQAVAWATALRTIALGGVGVLVPVFQSRAERLQRDSVKKDARAALRCIVFQAHRLVHTEIG
jgi:hypothetical protein